MKKLENMDSDEFMEAWTKAAENLDAAKAKVKEFADENRRREAQAQLDALPDEQKALFAQLLAPAGIESQESVQGGDE
jgi:hypothetical protein